MYVGQFLHPDHGWLAVVRSESCLQCWRVLARDFGRSVPTRVVVES